MEHQGEFIDRSDSPNGSFDANGSTNLDGSDTHITDTLYQLEKTEKRDSVCMVCFATDVTLTTCFSCQNYKICYRCVLKLATISCPGCRSTSVFDHFGVGELRYLCDIYQIDHGKVNYAASDYALDQSIECEILQDKIKEIERAKEKLEKHMRENQETIIQLQSDLVNQKVLDRYGPRTYKDYPFVKNTIEATIDKNDGHIVRIHTIMEELEEYIRETLDEEQQEGIHEFLSTIDVELTWLESGDIDEIYSDLPLNDVTSLSKFKKFDIHNYSKQGHPVESLHPHAKRRKINLI